MVVKTCIHIWYTNGYTNLYFVPKKSQHPFNWSRLSSYVLKYRGYVAIIERYCETTATMPNIIKIASVQNLRWTLNQRQYKSWPELSRWVVSIVLSLQCCCFFSFSWNIALARNSLHFDSQWTFGHTLRENMSGECETNCLQDAEVSFLVNLISPRIIC